MLIKSKFAGVALAAIVLAGGLVAGAGQAQAHKFPRRIPPRLRLGRRLPPELPLQHVPVGAEIQRLWRLYRLRARLPLVEGTRTIVDRTAQAPASPGRPARPNATRAGFSFAELRAGRRYRACARGRSARLSRSLK